MVPGHPGPSSYSRPGNNRPLEAPRRDTSPATLTRSASCDTGCPPSGLPACARSPPPARADPREGRRRYRTPADDGTRRPARPASPTPRAARTARDNPRRDRALPRRSRRPDSPAAPTAECRRYCPDGTGWTAPAPARGGGRAGAQSRRCPPRSANVPPPPGESTAARPGSRHPGSSASGRRIARADGAGWAPDILPPPRGRARPRTCRRTTDRTGTPPAISYARPGPWFSDYRPQTTDISKDHVFD